MFSLVAHGAEDIQQEEKDRRLFWVRLRDNQQHETKTLLFSTAHYTWQGHSKEIESDINLRKRQARNTVAALSRLRPENAEERALRGPLNLQEIYDGDFRETKTESEEVCFFGGDLNEGFWPKRILESAGYVDCFSAIGLPVQPTHPNRSSLAHEEVNSDAALDWLFAKGENVAPLLSSVIRNMTGLSSTDPDERHKLAVVPSDHCPVMSVYRVSW